MNGRERTSDGREKSGKNRLEFIRFGLVGVMNTGVDFLVFTLLIALGMHYLAAQTMAYAAGTLNSYAVNKLWTFRGQGSARGDRRRLGGELLRFVALNGASLLLSLALLYLLKDGLGFPALLAKLLVTVCTVVVNYAGSKLWVFR